MRLVAKLLGKGGYNQYPQRLISKRSNQDRTCTPRREHRRGGGLQRPQRYETRKTKQTNKKNQESMEKSKKKPENILRQVKIKAQPLKIYGTQQKQF